jgi:hypothetical protein
MASAAESARFESIRVEYERLLQEYERKMGKAWTPPRD